LAAATWFGAKERLTQARLAKLAGVDVMTASQVVRALETQGLVERTEHPEDPRANAITVTAAGKEKARKAIVAVETTDAEFFEPVLAQRAQLLSLFRALSRPEDE
jgi:DNA-binding MarR family transcriptional regulator